MTTVSEPQNSQAGPDHEPDLDDQSSSGVSRDPVKDYLKKIGRIPVLSAAQEVELSKAIEAGLFAEEKLAGTFGPIPAGIRPELGRIATEGRRAKALMIESNLRLVISVAKRYARGGTGTLQFIDVIQEGNLGIIRAVEKFDYTKGYKFSTYAMWWIRQAITRGLADSARTIRIPVHILELLNKLARVERELTQLLGPDVTDEDVAAEMGITIERLDQLRQIGHSTVSLDAAVGNDDANSSLESFLEDLLGTRPEDAAILSDEVDRILATLHANFTEREVTIILMRFGLYDGVPWILDEIAGHFGVTSERIRQIERKTKRALRTMLTKPQQAAS